MPCCCYYYNKGSKPSVMISAAERAYVDFETKYDLSNDEVPDLQRFIRSTELPFGEESIALALESFELSYETHDLRLAFLSLMIALETMLAPAGSELKYRISRNAAVLLGDSETRAAAIFEKSRDSTISDPDLYTPAARKR